MNFVVLIGYEFKLKMTGVVTTTSEEATTTTVYQITLPSSSGHCLCLSWGSAGYSLAELII